MIALLCMVIDMWFYLFIGEHMVKRWDVIDIVIFAEALLEVLIFLAVAMFNQGVKQ